MAINLAMGMKIKITVVTANFFSKTMEILSQKILEEALWELFHIPEINLGDGINQILIQNYFLSYQLEEEQGL